MTEKLKAHFAFKPIIRGVVMAESEELFPAGMLSVELIK
jgi:hypothetical protein